MQEDDWSASDRFIEDHLIGAGAARGDTLRANAAAGLPKINVSPAQGKFLHLLALSIGARRVLEIGTLGGYSTIWLARALGPDGKIVTLEFEPRHAEVARQNIAREALSDHVDIRIGPALDLLPKLRAEGFGPVDLAFIDADKENNAEYFNWALEFSRPGGLIIVDNVIRAGAVADLSNMDSMAVGGRRLFDAVAKNPRVSATALQTVGSKGWDGFLIARVE